MSHYGPFDLSIPCFSTTCFLGGSGNGKSTHLVKLIQRRNQVFSKPVEKVNIVMPRQDDLYDVLKTDPDVTFVESISDLKVLLAESQFAHLLLVLDDIWLGASKDDKDFIYQVVARLCHHFHYSLIAVNQVVFQRNDHKWIEVLRNIHQYLFVKNPDRVMQMFFSQYDSLKATELFKWYRYEMDSKPFATFFFSDHRARNAAVRCRSSALSMKGDRVYFNL